MWRDGARLGAVIIIVKFFYVKDKNKDRIVNRSKVYINIKYVLEIYIT